MRKFWRRSESTVLRVKTLDRRMNHLLYHGGRYLARAPGEGFSVIDGVHHVLCRFKYFVPFLAIRRCQREQNPLESRTAIVILWGEIGSTKKWTAIGSKECSQRPPTLTADGLHCGLISAVDVRPFVAINLHCDILIVDDLRDLGILVRLAIHHVTPVAPHRAHVEQHWLVFALSLLESVGAPLVPFHGLMHRRTQIRRRRAR